MAFAKSPPPVHRPAASPTLRRWWLGAAGADSAAAAGSPAPAAAHVVAQGAVPAIPTDVHSRLPRLPEPMLARPRLLERLNSWAPVTVLQAITGTGKTTPW